MHFFKALSAVVVLLFAVSVFAQDAKKVELYEKFTKNYNKGPAEQAIAREAVKQYLEKYGKDAKTEEDRKIAAYVLDWANRYDKAQRGFNLFEAIKAKKADDAFAQAKQVFVDDPEDVEAYYHLAGLGYEAAASGNRKNDADALAYARKAAEMLEAGKSFDPKKPMTAEERANAVGYTYFLVASLEAPTSAANAKANFLKAIATGTTIKNDPSVYLSLYNIYNEGEYAPLSRKYNAECSSERLAITQPCKDLLAQANAVMDKIVDALARAVAYAKANPAPERYATLTPRWIEAMRPYFKQRNNGSDAGLDAYIKGITAKPMPN